VPVDRARCRVRPPQRAEAQAVARRRAANFFATGFLAIDFFATGVVATDFFATDFFAARFLLAGSLVAVASTRAFLAASKLDFARCPADVIDSPAPSSAIATLRSTRRAVRFAGPFAS